MSTEYTSSYEFEGHIDYTKEKNKLEAAKETLIKQIKSIGPNNEIAIISFNSNPNLIYKGSSSNLEEISNNISQIKVEGSTNISSHYNIFFYFP